MALHRLLHLEAQLRRRRAAIGVAEAVEARERLLARGDRGRDLARGEQRGAERAAGLGLGVPLMLAAVVVMQMVSSRTVYSVVLVLAIFSWPQIARIARSAASGSEAATASMMAMAATSPPFRT